MNATAKVRSIKARRTGGTCRGCKRLIILGDIITRHGGRWRCTDCATAIATTLRAKEVAP